MKQLQLFDSTGKLVPLGKEIASGGEGVIYAVPSLNGLVAKVYREPLKPDKRSKLLAMVKGCDEPLKNIAAWPVATLHNSGRQVCGFLMPKVSGCEPIHNLYSPGCRKHRYPAMTWEFLVHVARNTAAAFQVVHAHGHVIGDVNPNLVFVAKDGIVKLIDCDSFHIVVDGTRYPCEVGVVEFTPPELQGYSGFRGIPRAANHDNFGLALLVFQLLMMGRHPFSGVFSGEDSLTLKDWIEQFCYAFSRNASEKQMAPPPKCVTPAILPESIAQLFERAFTAQGVQREGRPSAQDWLVALDSLKKNLRDCGEEPRHKYFRELSCCPWCQQEKQNGNLFFIHSPAAKGKQAQETREIFDTEKFYINKVWSQIVNIDSPGPAPEITINCQGGVASQNKISIKNKVYLWMNDSPLSIRTKQEALERAKKNFISKQKIWEEEAGDISFREKYDALLSLKRKYNFLHSNLMRPMSTIDNHWIVQDVAEKKMKHFEEMLLAGPAQLTQIKAQILQRRKELLPMVEEAARQVAQAQADLDALG